MHQPTYLYYDGKARLTNRTDNVGTVLYGFDANDNRTSVAGNGLTNTWTYDAYNRVSTYKDAYGNLIQYKYDANGNLTNLVYPGGKNVFYTFDADNHLTQVKDWSGRITTFQYDLAGRLTESTRPNGTFRTLSYDSAGEVTNIWEQMANGLPIAWFRYNWNPNSTMNWEFAAPLPHTNTLQTRNMTFNAANELYSVDGSQVTEDGDGNMTYGPLTNDNFVTYTFDARNRLSNVGGVTNVYDAMNNRIIQTYGTNTVSYVVNPNAKLPQVLERTKNGVTTYYIYGMGLLYQITETATATNTLTYHYDYRGSTIALTDDSGIVRDRFEYSLYATLTYRAGTDETPFLFNGRYGVMSDPNGLLYMLNRYYNPFICRFISSDPSGFAGGLNFYAYANLNPVSYLDPFGLGALGELVDTSWLTSSSVNSAPNVAINVNANANLGPFISAPGTPTPTPYFDPNLPFYYTVNNPTEGAYMPSPGWQNRVATGLTIATVVQSLVTPGEEEMVPGEIESAITGFRAVSDDELSQIVADNYRFYSPAGSSTPTGNLGKFFYTDQSAAQQAANYFSKQEGINYSVIQAQVPASSVTRTFTGIDSQWIPGGANAFFSEYPSLYKAVITPR
jgi:RHS repeat-associated protein